MNAEDYKYKLQRSLDKFGYCLLIVTVALSGVVLLQKDFWLIGFFPTIVVFALIGVAIVLRAMMKLTVIENKLNEMSEEEFYRKFIGVNSVNKIFYAFIPMFFCVSVLILYGCNIEVFSLNNMMSPFVSIPIAILLMYVIYIVLTELSFVIFFISAIYSLSPSIVGDKIYDEVSDRTIPEGFDTDKNLKKLILKCNKRIAWFESRMNEDNKPEYMAKIEIYQVMIREIEDLLCGIDI